MTPNEQEQFIDAVAAAVAIAVAQDKVVTYPPEHAQWVELAIQRQAQSIKFRQAIIEKSLTGLVWAVIVGFVFIAREFLNNHGFRI
jgi:GAF domain-containing protein